MRYVWLLIVLVGLASLAARPAAAQTAPAMRGESAAAYRFGQAMEFRLNLEGNQPIAAAVLFFTAGDLAQTISVDLEFEPASKLVLVYELDLTQQRLAPFSQITYWWAAVDQQGNEWRSPDQQIEYADDQFDWRQLTRNNVNIYWTGDDLTLGQTALDIVTEALPHIEDIVPPVVPAAPIRIYIYPSLADLRAALRLAGRDWVGAHAQPDLGVILVVAANPRTARVDLRQSIPHELVHLYLYQATGVQYPAVPRWFDEGLATFMETEPNPIYAQLVATAVENGTTIPFADLCRHFPEAEAEVALAYAQSGDLIRFIQTVHGRQALREMVGAFKDGADCQTAVRRVLNISLNELEQLWLRSHQPGSDTLRFLHQNGLILLILLGGFGLTGLLLWSPNRKPTRR